MKALIWVTLARLVGNSLILSLPNLVAFAISPIRDSTSVTLLGSSFCLMRVKILSRRWATLSSDISKEMYNTSCPSITDVTAWLAKNNDLPTPGGATTMANSLPHSPPSREELIALNGVLYLGTNLLSLSFAHLSPMPTK